MHNFVSRSQRRLVIAIFLVVATSAMAQPVPTELFNGLKWRLIGPFRGGRAVAVAGVPGDPTTFYFGSVNGGIWKTTDAGVVWTPIFDGQTVASIGALAIAPSDPKTIYAGTGESDIRSSLSFGNGVYKSVDGGQTWIHLGLDGHAPHQSDRGRSTGLECCLRWRAWPRLCTQPGARRLQNYRRGTALDEVSRSRNRNGCLGSGDLFHEPAAVVCGHMAYLATALEYIRSDRRTGRWSLPLTGCR